MGAVFANKKGQNPPRIARLNKKTSKIAKTRRTSPLFTAALGKRKMKHEIFVLHFLLHSLTVCFLPFSVLLQTGWG